MEIDHLILFLDLIETRNFTLTAERRFTTQSTVSKQIHALEKSIGTPLFVRKHRRIELTEAGALMLPYAKKIVADYQNMRQALVGFTTETDHTLRLHTIPTLLNYLGFQEITNFLKQHPEIKLQFIETEGIDHSLFSFANTSDVLFTRIFDDKERLGFDSFVSEKDHFVIVLPKSHLLAEQSIVDLQQVKTESFLLLGKGTSIYEPIVSLCRLSGFEPTITYEGARIDLILSMVADGLGITIAMEKTVTGLLGDKLVSLPITPNTVSSLCFLRKQGQHSFASDLFWQYLNEKKNVDR